MRRLGLVLLPLLAAAALAQDASKPAPAPAPVPAPADAKPADPARGTEFIGTDAIRKTDGLVVHFYRVNYVDAALLKTELEKWKSSPSAKITSDGPTVIAVGGKNGAAGPPFQNTLRIEDTEENWPALRRILDMIDVPQMQVYVEAKIVEVSYTDDLRYGTEAHIKRSPGDTFFQGSDIKFPNRLDTVNQFTTTFREVTKYATFDYIVDLAESGANARVISKPVIFASQGETATIRVGDTEPIVQQTLSANNVTATTEFKPTGMTLEVQPLLIGRDGVRARISAKLSRVSQFRVTATSSNLQVVNPVISERTADTVVTVPDGETLILGGLDQDFDSEQKTGIPVLMDIPYLGFLFGSTTKRKERTEVMFFLTFSIRSPSEARVVAPPSEKERSER